MWWPRSLLANDVPPAFVASCDDPSADDASAFAQ